MKKLSLNKSIKRWISTFSGGISVIIIFNLVMGKSYMDEMKNDLVIIILLFIVQLVAALYTDKD
ncbi:hypothetical protein [Salinibacillus kushneri]|uniref:hypothetical protein n=1 Tax=Salinibacillus kushneri TaxID=237682 RepID=UPI000B85515E|nr:hypothetical protein [Salinibacillus kushneri]